MKSSLHFWVKPKLCHTFLMDYYHKNCYLLHLLGSSHSKYVHLCDIYGFLWSLPHKYNEQQLLLHKSIRITLANWSNLCHDVVSASRYSVLKPYIMRKPRHLMEGVNIYKHVRWVRYEGVFEKVWYKTIFMIKAMYKKS